MKLNPSLVKSTIVAALGGLLFGFDTAVISGTTAALTQNYQLSPKLLGITVASALWGTVIGSLLAGFPGEWIGRRDSLRVMAILYLISGLGCAAAWSWPSQDRKSTRLNSSHTVIYTFPYTTLFRSYGCPHAELPALAEVIGDHRCQRPLGNSDWITPRRIPR